MPEADGNPAADAAGGAEDLGVSALLRPRPEDGLFAAIGTVDGPVELRGRRREDPDFQITVGVRDLNNTEDEPKVNRPKPAIEVKARWSF